jgi:laminin alpha 1/2
MKISVSWHTGRGDTAGTYTKAPDVVFEGAGMTIGFGAVRYLRRKNATIEVSLTEDGWYHIPATLYDIEARSFRSRRPDFIGKAVSKVEFMRILGSLSRMLIRTKYHTDQLEGT